MSITPFDRAGALDEAALRAHLRRLRDAGVGVYVGSSASGEGFSLDVGEIDRVLAIAVEELSGRVGVRATSCEVRHAGEMVDFLRRVAHHRVDAVHVFAPEMGHAARPTAPELERYYSAVLDETSMPVVLSSYQALGFDLPPSLLERLLDRFPHIVGFFYGGSDVRYLSRMIERFADRIEVRCAGPGNAVTTLALGGDGFMGHEGNLAPRLVASVVCAFTSGDRPALRDAYRKLMAIHAMHHPHGGPVRAMKPLLDALGLPGGTIRPPRVAIDAEQLRDVLDATLKLEIPELRGCVVRR